MKYICKNLDQVHNALLKELYQTMSDAESELFLTGLDNNSKFYSKGKPKWYKRTGQLGNSLKTTGVVESGDHFEATVYEDMKYEYTTGTYATPHIFSEAEVGGSGILGNSGFWKATEDKAEPLLHKHVKRHFKQK